MFNYIFEARWGCMYDSNGVSKTWLNIFYVRHTIKNNFFTSMCQKIVSKKMPMMRCSISLFSVSKWYLHIVSMFIFFESECQVAVFSHPHANNTELKNWTISECFFVKIFQQARKWIVKSDQNSFDIKKIMAGSRRSIQKLLDRHKLQIARELDPSQSAILTQLTKKGVIISEEERQILVWFIR